ncbi:hypothetical protein BDR03DRAFT_977623 [Suillus americanus]|nr:hypothetical protein BDR03DRAFT_977623 [Suillus americanus]
MAHAIPHPPHTPQPPPSMSSPPPVSQFGKISKGPAMAIVMGPSGVFAAGKKDSKRETLSRANSNSNMFHMLSQNPQLAAEASAMPSRIKSPKIELNANVKDGRFRYDRDFLMQFMHICKEKPPTLPALDVLGIEPVDQTSFPMARGGSGRHRNASGAMPVSANRQASVGLGIGGFQKPSIPSGFQMGNFQSPGSKLTSEERFAMSNSRSASTSSASSQYRSAMVRTPSTGGPGHPMHGTNRIRSKRGERRGDANKTPMSQDEHSSGFGAASILGAGFEPVVPLELSANRWVPASTTRKVQPDVDSPELVDRKVKALLNKLTMEKFETISDQIIHWANKSVNEKDGRTLIQVIRLVFEKATDEAAWSEMYARLCRKMMEQISPEDTASSTSAPRHVCQHSGSHKYDPAQLRQPPADHQKPSVPKFFQIGMKFRSPVNKLTSEERFTMPSNVRPASTSRATAESRAPMVHTSSQGGHGHLMHGTGRTHSRRAKGSGFDAAPTLRAGSEPVVPLKLSANRWVASTTRKVQPGVDLPELVDRKVKALLNKLTMGKFDTISDQIIHWANKSVNEKDGRTLIQVIRLVFEKAIDEAVWSEMYARLCRKMMEQISPEVQDERIKNMEGKPIRGGHLFRKYLLNRCQEYFERGWFAKEATAAAAAAKASDNQATEAVHEKKGTLDTGFNFDEYHAAQMAKRQGLNLITFIGELFKVRMLTERIMHECVKKLLGNIENPEEENIESLCQLLKTVGQLLDTPKASAHMDVYFNRMKELGKSRNISTRMQFMLQDVIELRDRIWMSRDAAPLTIAAVHVLAAKEKAAAEDLNCQMSMSRGGSRRGSDCHQENSPDDWAVAGDYVPRAPPKASDLSPFGDITNGPPRTLVMGSSGIFGASKDDKREALSQTNSSSNMFHMLSQNPELAAEVSTKPGCSSSRKPSIDLDHDGVPEPAVQHKELQLLPRFVRAADESIITPLEDERESTPIAVTEADIKKEIDRYVRAFFAVRNLEEANIYFTDRPHELCFRLVDNRQIHMSRGGPRGGSEHKQEHGPDGCAAPGGSIPWTPPKADDLSQFGKISVGASMVMSPSSALVGREKDSKRETLSRTNSSSNMLHILSQNPKLAAKASTKPSHSSRLKQGVDLGHAGVPEPAVQRRKIPLLPGSVGATEENATTPSEEEPDSVPAMSEATVRKIDEDVKEFFMVRNLQEADDYFPNIPDEHRSRLVDKLVTSALESKEIDARLVGDFFAQAMSNGQCTLEEFEQGFMHMAEFLDDIAIDAPKAFDYMAIMLKGAGFQNEPERLYRVASKLEDSDKLVSLVV